MQNLNCEIDTIKYKAKKESVTLSKFIIALVGVSRVLPSSHNFSFRKSSVFVYIKDKSSGQGRASSASRNFHVVIGTGLC